MPSILVRPAEPSARSAPGCQVDDRPDDGLHQPPEAA